MNKNLKLLFLSVIFISSTQWCLAHGEDTDDVVRLTCKDVRNLALMAEDVLLQTTNIIVVARELAFESSEGTLGSNDRTYLDTERNQLNQEASRILSQSSFTDSFGTNYDFFRDGLKFLVVVQSNLGGQEFPMIFKLAPMPTSNMGRVAEIEFDSSSFDYDVTRSASNLKVNGTYLRIPADRDDLFSFSKNAKSAIALVKVFNEKKLITGIKARALPAVVTVRRVDFHSLQLLSGDLNINGIDILGDKITSLPQLIDLINTYGEKSGVGARLAWDTTSDLELVAWDGRNISLKLGKKMLPYFNQRFKEGENILLGGLRLESTRGFIISGHQKNILNLTDSIKVELGHDGFLQTDLRTQASAKKAVSHYNSALNDLDRKRTVFGTILDACPEE